MLRTAALFPLGYASSIALWFIYARYTNGGCLSFQWTVFPGLIAFLGLGYLTVLLSPKDTSNKHEGLTLWSERTPKNEARA